jgi:spore coat protein U-like protein
MKCLPARIRRASGAALAALTLILAAPANAAHTCTVGIGNLDFGMYFGNQTTSSATMSVTCTLTSSGSDTVAFTATLSTGAGSYVQRLLTNVGSPSDTLPYNLYLDTVPAILNTSVWGDGSGATVVASGSMKLQQTISPVVTVTFTVAGAIAAVATMPPPGAYVDLIAGTVTYN